MKWRRRRFEFRGLLSTDYRYWIQHAGNPDTGRCFLHYLAGKQWKKIGAYDTQREAKAAAERHTTEERQ